MDALLSRIMEETEGVPLQSEYDILSAEKDSLTERDLAFFLAGALVARDRFFYRSNEDLDISGAAYPSVRMDSVLYSITQDVKAAT